jgi:hypothetical protein
MAGGGGAEADEKETEEDMRQVEEQSDEEDDRAEAREEEALRGVAPSPYRVIGRQFFSMLEYGRDRDQARISALVATRMLVSERNSQQGGGFSLSFISINGVHEESYLQ